MEVFGLERRNILLIEILIVFFYIFCYNIYFYCIENNKNDLDEINFDIFGISKEEAKLNSEKYPYIEENLKQKNNNINIPDNINNNIIVGIDFGTINSGFTYNIENDITKMKINQKEPSEFGLSRKNQKGIYYSSSSSVSMMNYQKNELNSIIYIRGIKSILYPNNKIINDNICFIYPKSIINGLNILNALIEYFIMIKIDILKEINENPKFKKEDENEDKILWIISIPSAWKEFEKQLIKDALIKSGMNNNKLIYESDAASLAFFYDTYIPDTIKKHNKYFMLIDSGGYSVDITVNKILDKKGSLKEIISTSSNSGAYKISEEIIKILEEIFGKSAINKVKKNEPGEWIKTIKDINKAIENTYCLDGIEIFNVNAHFNTKAKNPFIYYQNSKYEIEYNGYSLSIPANLIGKIILNNINYIKQNIEEIIKILNNKKIKLDSIIITGGLSQSNIFKNEMENYSKGKKFKIDYLTSYKTVISKGSVLYGIINDKTLTRISPITIGIENNDKIEILIKKDDEINNSLTVIKYIKPILENQKIIQVNIYVSDEKILLSNELKNKFFGRLLLKLNKEKQSIIQLTIKYDICLNFYAINYENGRQIETEFQYFK